MTSILLPISTPLVAQVEDGSVHDLGDTVGIEDVGDSDRNLWRGCWNLDVIASMASKLGYTIWDDRFPPILV